MLYSPIIMMGAFMKNLFLSGVATSILLIGGCATTQITPMQFSKKGGVQRICIKHNPKVIVQNFEEIITSRLEHHDILVQVYDGEKPEQCEYSLRYVAYQKWDISMVLTRAEISIYRDERKIGSAEYKLHAGGLLNPTKYKSNESKIEPLIDQLLGGN